MWEKLIQYDSTLDENFKIGSHLGANFPGLDALKKSTNIEKIMSDKGVLELHGTCRRKGFSVEIFVVRISNSIKDVWVACDQKGNPTTCDGCDNVMNIEDAKDKQYDYEDRI